MKTQAINNQSFGIKKFRLPIKSITYGEPHASYTVKTSENIVREYPNPMAAALYKKANEAESTEEKIRLFDSMGHYRIRNLDAERRLDNILNRLLSI
ncbi:MAG: hypothetical protein K6E29_06125 [Cyanobacteria bacterium RUI128]|nr:hypothetical protein [Cyanobacteria bacterium RUI128]